MSTETLDLVARDVSGQSRANVRGIPGDYSVGELIEGLLEKMELPRSDTSGRPLSYHGHLEREGRHLHGSEIVGDVLVPEDEIVLQPDIEAG
jgi:hypothetical protein